MIEAEACPDHIHMLISFSPKDTLLGLTQATGSAGGFDCGTIRKKHTMDETICVLAERYAAEHHQEQLDRKFRSVVETCLADSGSGDISCSQE